MSKQWEEYLPLEYRQQTVPPVYFEHHVDESVQAERTLGFDESGKRCFYRHRFSLTEERFDSEEFPIEVALYREIVLAWRIANFKWLKLKVYADRLDRCPQRVAVLPIEITEETLLQS